MHKWRKRASQEVRDNLERYLNYPLTRKISLGDYGFYSGRDCQFIRRGNLSDKGIVIPKSGLQPSVAESYSTGNAVDFETTVDVTSKKPVASISFQRNNALVLQSCRMVVETANTNSLEKLLVAEIQRGLQWDFNYVVITEVWHAEGFTHLVSGGEGATITIEASPSSVGLPTGLEFLADPKLKLSVTSHRRMSYQAIGQEDVQPYFDFQKLIRGSDSRITLQPYAKQAWLWSLAS